MSSGEDADSSGAVTGATETRGPQHVFWVRYARLGTLISLLTAAGLFLYLALAPERPHIGALRVTGAAVAGFSVMLIAVPVHRLTGSRWRWLYFYSWSFASIGVIAYAAALDGGASSPLAIALFLPLLYVAMAYPPQGVAMVAAADLVAFVVVGIGDHAPNTPYEVLVGLVLALSGVMSVVGARHRAFERAALSRIRNRLMEEATVDSLTGCANRRAFLAALETEAARALRHGRPLALISLDIDRFKAVNDTYGHPAGDRVLVALGQSLRAHTRPGDVVARLGGDEFSILLPECGRTDAARLAVRLQSTTVTPVGLPPVHMSVGFAVADGTAPFDVRDLISRADQALYAEKRARPAPPVSVATG
jgi:diguanylate cyclase (GGDEF)-like protein